MSFTINMNNQVHTYSESILDSEICELSPYSLGKQTNKKTGKKAEGGNPQNLSWSKDTLFVCVHFK